MRIAGRRGRQGQEGRADRRRLGPRDGDDGDRGQGPADQGGRELKVRSRLFLEGNYFVDLQPGHARAPKRVESGRTIPPSQTASPVQFGQVLTALQSDTREDLQTLPRRSTRRRVEGQGARGFNQADQVLGGGLPQHRDLPTGRRSAQSRARPARACSRARARCSARCRVTRRRSSARAPTSTDDRRASPARRTTCGHDPGAARRARVGRPALASLNERVARSIRAFARDALPGARSSRRRSTCRSRSSSRRAGSCREERAARPGRRPARRRCPRSRAQPEPDRSRSRRRARSPRARTTCCCRSRRRRSPTRTSRTTRASRSSRSRRARSSASRARAASPTRTRRSSACSGGGGPTTVSSRPASTGEQLFGQPPCPIDGVRPIAADRAPGVPPRHPVRDAGAAGPERAGGPGGEHRAAQADAGRRRATRPRSAEARRWRTPLIAHLKARGKGSRTIDPLAVLRPGRAHPGGAFRRSGCVRGRRTARYARAK